MQAQLVQTDWQEGQLSQPTKYLVMWSGGIDSTYTLAKLLKETTHEIHAHHIHFVNRENRGKQEMEAVQKLLPRLRGIREFQLSESMIDHRQCLRVPFDMAVACFEAGVVQKNLSYQKIPCDKWTIGTHSAEGHDWERWEVIKHGTKAACWPEKEPEFELQESVSKKEEIEYLESLGLLSDCWFCRVPREDKACGYCKTCQEVKEAA